MNAPITKGSIFVDRHGQEWCVQEVLVFGRYTCRKTDSPHYFFGLDEWTGRQIHAARAELHHHRSQDPMSQTPPDER